MNTMSRFGMATAMVLVGLLQVPLAGQGMAQSPSPRIEKVANKSLSGAAYARLRNLSYEQCERRCLDDQRCVALLHYRDAAANRSFNCALYQSYREAGDAENSDVGYKRTATASSSPGLRRVEQPAQPSVGSRLDADKGVRGRALGETKGQYVEKTDQPSSVAAVPPPVATAPPVAVRPAPTTRSITPPAPSLPSVALGGGSDATATSRGVTRSASPSAQPAASAPAPGAVAADKPAEWHAVPVFYGTDRNRKDTAKRIAYANDRARRLELGQAMVTVPRNHQVPKIERPWALSIPYVGVVYQEAEDPAKHFTIKEIRSLSKADLLALIKTRLGGSESFRNQSMIFIHGYNVGFDDALYRTAQISYDLQFDGATFTYSWPSGNGWTSYPYDRDSAEQAEPYLYEFLQMVLNESGTGNISIIAHSMGNQMLLRTLRSLKQRNPEVSRINQIVLAAPDVDRDAFEFFAAEIRGIAKGITLYAAGNDVALEASRIFAGNRPRAGDVPPQGPVIVEGIDTIDISSVSTGYLALNHSNYAERTDLLTDLKHLIRSGTRPPELRITSYRRVNVAGGVYWRYGN